MSKINFKKLIVSLAAPLLAGFVGSAFTSPAVQSWYPTINKPTWNPPAWVFAPVWTTLFVMMGIALYLVWSKKSNLKVKEALRFFTVQMILNVLWSVIFFGMGSFWLAFAEIVVLWIAILFCVVTFIRIDKIAGVLLIPYLLWVSFASFLTFTIASLN